MRSLVIIFLLLSVGVCRADTKSGRSYGSSRLKELGQDAEKKEAAWRKACEHLEELKGRYRRLRKPPRPGMRRTPALRKQLRDLRLEIRQVGRSTGKLFREYRRSKRRFEREELQQSKAPPQGHDPGTSDWTRKKCPANTKGGSPGPRGCSTGSTRTGPRIPTGIGKYSTNFDGDK